MNSLAILLYSSWAAAGAVVQDPTPHVDDDLRVLVLDPNGTAIAGLDVHLVARSRVFDEHEVSHMDRYVARATTDGSGHATIEDASRFASMRDLRDFVLRVPVPPLADSQVVVDLEKPPYAPVDLYLPLTGSLILEFESETAGTVILRAAREARSSIWDREHAYRAEIDDRTARFDRVGLCEEFEYQVSVDGSSSRLTGVVEGPLSVGETVRRSIDGLGAHPVLVGRLLTEDLRPLSSTSFMVSVRTGQAGSSRGRGHALTSDAEGRFRFPLTIETPNGGYRLVEFRDNYPDPASVAAIGESTALFDLSDPLPRGDHELADVVLASHGAELLLARMDDAAVIDRFEWHDELARKTRTGRQRQLEATLLEMGRRRSAEVVAFLQARIDVRRASRAVFIRPGILELLTCLRRAQGSPAPLAIEIAGPEVLTCDAFALPTLRGNLRNVDKETFPISSRGGYTGGWVLHMRVTGTNASGGDVQMAPIPSVMGGGARSLEPLEPGQAVPFEIDLGRYVTPTEPGEYRLKIQFHDDEWIMNEPDVSGWVLHESDEFVLRVQARTVQMTRARRAQIRAWIDGLDLDSTIPVTRARWSEHLVFESEPTSAADHLFHTGVEAVPILLEALGSSTDPPPRGSELRRQAWIAAMLHNITGALDPAAEPFRMSLGRSRWIANWPTVDAQSRRNLAKPGGNQHPVRPDTLARLVQRWRDLRACYPLELVD